MTETSAQPIYIIMPILGARDYTATAIADCLNQSIPTRILLINQGVDDDFRAELEGIAEEFSDRVLLWSHQPPLPSLAATWNRALDFVWKVGGELALVVNNDVRLHRQTVDKLGGVLVQQNALFVSAVGVTPEQFDPNASVNAIDEQQRGGPDFSCFLISHECHQRYRFDEQFIPAFCEDLDTHRRVLLDGEGPRMFSVNLPYLHYGSMTLKTADAAKRQAIEASISAGSRAYYERKWGGGVNQETFLVPFGRVTGSVTAVDDGTATTPYLQAHQYDEVKADV